MNTSALTLSSSFLSSRSERPIGDPYLRFQLTEGVDAVLAMQQVQEVYTLPTHRLTPMPNLPTCILGLMNRRSQVLWVVDLLQLLGTSSLGTNCPHYNLVLARSGELVFGLAVQQIEGFFWMPQTAIQSPPSQLSPTLQTYLRGCTVQDQEILLVLDAEAILHSSALRSSP